MKLTRERECEIERERVIKTESKKREREGEKLQNKRVVLFIAPREKQKERKIHREIEK